MITSRADLMTFLKRSSKAKFTLKREKAELFAKFEKIWAVREQHMVKQLPSQYLFFLLPCYVSDCPHPVCQDGQASPVQTWFEGGPPITYLPLPIPDKDRSWGQQCSSCSDCSRHYLNPEQAFINTPAAGAVCPPSATISNLSKHCGRLKHLCSK